MSHTVEERSTGDFSEPRPLRARRGGNVDVVPEPVSAAPSTHTAAAGAWRAALDGLNPRHIKGPKLPLVVFSLHAVLGGLGGQMLGLAGPEIEATFGTSVVGLVMVSSITGILTVLLGIPLGFLADRYNRVVLVRIAAISQPIATGLQSFAPNFPLFTAGQVVGELSTLPGNTAMGPLQSDYYPQSCRARVFGIMSMAGTIGGLIAVPVLGFMLEYLGWRVATLSLSIFGLLVAALTFWLKEPKRGIMDLIDAGGDPEMLQRVEPPKPTLGEALRGTWAIRSVRMQAIAGFVGGFSAPLTLLVGLILASRFALSPSERSMIALIGMVLSIPAIAYGTSLADKLLVLKPSAIVMVQAGAQVLTSAAMIGQAFAPNLAVFIALDVIPIVVNATLAPVQLAVFSLIVPPRYRGVGMQIFTPFSLIAMLLAPALTQMATGINLQMAFVFFAPFMLVSAVLYFLSATTVADDIRAAKASYAAEIAAQDAADRDVDPGLVARDLDIAYDTALVLRQIDLDIPAGSVVGIVGAPGAGKTSLLKALAGIVPLANGAIFLGSREITQLPAAGRAELGVIYVDAHSSTFADLTVSEHLRLAGADEAALVDIERLAPTLWAQRDVVAARLSLAQRQLLTAVQVWVRAPRVAALDELGNGLDRTDKAALHRIVEACSERGTTLVWATAGVESLPPMCQEVIRLDQGSIAFRGTLAQAWRESPQSRGSRVSLRRRSTKATAQDTPALELRDVAALQMAPFSLTVASGEIIGLISNDGSQAEDVLDLISGHTVLTGGTVVVRSNELAGSSARNRADAGLVRGHADPRLWGALTVEETLRLVLHRQRKNRRGRSETDHLTATLSAFGLDAVRDARMDTVPLGVRRIVELAVLSSAEPSVMLLEQPTSGLPPADVEALVPQLQRLASSQKLAIVVVESDRGVLGQLCHRIAWFDDGHLREVGIAADVLTHAHIAVQKEETHE